MTTAQKNRAQVPARATLALLFVAGCVGPHLANDPDGMTRSSAPTSLNYCTHALSALVLPTSAIAATAAVNEEMDPADFDASLQTTAEETPPLPEAMELAAGLDETPRERAALPEGDWRRFAVRFDRWLWKEMNDNERQSYEAECRSGSNDPYCSTVKNASRLEHYASRVHRAYVAPPARVIEPVAFVFKKKTISNWNTVRKADLPPLLAGLKLLSPEERNLVEKRALAEARVPNKIAIAVAALMEDDAKDRAGYRRVAALFERGAKSTSRKEARDRENYLTRAALYRWQAEDYRKVAQLLASAKPSDAYSGRSLYWLLRAQDKLSDRKGAAKTYQRLRTDHALSFHAILAAVERGDDPGEALGSTAAPLVPGTRKKPVAKFIAQIEQLRAANRQRSADIVARLSLEGRFHAETDARVYIASLADPYVKVTTMPPLLIAVRRLWARAPMQVAYPNDFLPAARSAVSGLTAVDPFFLLALCRKESAFDARAVSLADAQGLCQIQPATARRTVGNDSFDLFQPAQNLRIGARYLQTLFAEFEGKPALAAAAYNAGEDAVRRWRTRLVGVTDPVLFLDLTPYRETRDYVAQVLGNYYWYRRLYADDPAAAVRSLVARK